MQYIIKCARQNLLLGINVIMLRLLQKRKKSIKVAITALCVVLCLQITMSILELEERHSLVTNGKYKYT